LVSFPKNHSCSQKKEAKKIFYNNHKCNSFSFANLKEMTE